MEGFAVLLPDSILSEPLLATSGSQPPNPPSRARQDKNGHRHEHHPLLDRQFPVPETLHNSPILHQGNLILAPGSGCEAQESHGIPGSIQDFVIRLTDP